MNKKKKFISLMCKFLSPIMSLYLILGTTSVALAAEPLQLQVVLGTVSGHPGEEVTMPISFKNVPTTGISACNFIIKYDPTKIVAESATAGDIIKNSAADFQEPTIDAANGQIIFMFSDASGGDRIISQNGTFANVKFKINQNAGAGAFPVCRFQNSNEDFADGQTVTKLDPYPQFTNGTVNVQEVVNNMQVVMGNISGHPGDEVTMPISFKNVPTSGISACNFIIKYDPTKMVAESATAGGIIINSAADFQEPTIDAANGQMIFMFSDASGGDRIINQDGTFANIKFKINQNVASGDYAVSRFQNVHEDFADGVTVTKLNPYPQFVDGCVSVDATVVVSTDEQDVAADTAALDLGDTSAVTANLALPTTGTNGSTISWVSSNSAFVGNDGTIIRPAAGQPDATLTLTATISKGTAQGVTKEFTVTVKAMKTLDEEAVDGANNALTLGNIDQVMIDLILPTKGANGTTISWSSNNTAVVGNDGTVIRPAIGKPDATVVLTATITKGSASTTKNFKAIVKAQQSAVKILISKVTGVKDAQGTATVSLKNVVAATDGISSMQFVLKYDPSKLEILTVTAGDKIVTLPDSNFIEPQIDSTNGYVTLGFNDSTMGENPIIKDGVFAKLSFKIKADAISGGNIIEYNPTLSDGIADNHVEPVPAEFMSVLYGDANNDGKTTFSDAQYLMRCKMTKPGYNLKEAGILSADANCDANTTFSDAQYLMRAIMNKPGYNLPGVGK